MSLRRMIGLGRAAYRKSVSNVSTIVRCHGTTTTTDLNENPYVSPVPGLNGAVLHRGDLAFNRSSLYDVGPEMTYGGALSFLRRKYTKEIFGHGVNGTERADVVVSGIPYDGAVTYRSGARLGPRAVRCCGRLLCRCICSEASPVCLTSTPHPHPSPLPHSPLNIVSCPFSLSVYRSVLPLFSSRNSNPFLGASIPLKPWQ